MTNAELKQLSKELAKTIVGAEISTTPFKHLVVDEFLPNSLALRAADAFSDEVSWEHSCIPELEVKSRSQWRSEFDCPESISDVVRVLNSSLVLQALSTTLNIVKLLPDPYFGGGGLNSSGCDGVLDVHCDGNYSDATGLHRRANVLLYLTPGWAEENGGAFGLFSETGDQLITKYTPYFNRLVIFETTDTSFHGICEPINPPNGRRRNSLLLYYYTAAPRPESQVIVREPHSALWRKRSFLDKKNRKTRQVK